jgi:predicted Fe-Mo cluster-binding NifX family protein
MKRMLLLALGTLILAPVMAHASQDDTVRIAVASDSKNATSPVGSKAGHSAYYLIFDGAGELIEVIDNPYKDATKRAGPSVADYLAEKGVTTVVAGAFGEKMVNAVKSNGMTYLERPGAANDAVQETLSPGNSLLKKLDENLNPESYEAYRKLINIEPDGKKKEFVLFTVKKGADKVAAVFLSPASEKGRSTLRLEDNMWLYIPNVGKPIRITSLQSVVGGVFNNSDILRLDYATEYDVERTEETDNEYHLYLRAKTKGVAYDRLRVWADKDSLLPTKIECLTEASMLIKTLHFKVVKDFGGGIIRPSVIETDSPLQEGYKSVMIFAEIKQRQLEDEVFTLTFMPNLESLR